jgi:hypothetical protein
MLPLFLSRNDAVKSNRKHRRYAAWIEGVTYDSRFHLRSGGDLRGVRSR